MRWGMRLFGIGLAALGAACVAYLIAFKRGWIGPRPTLFSVLVVILLVGLLAETVRTVIQLARRKTRLGSASGKLLLLVGGLAIFGAGLANWLLRLQGYMILSEGDAMPIFGGRHLQEFEAGPLAQPREMDLTLQLSRVKLVPGPRGPQLESLLLVQRGGAREQLKLVGASSAAAGPLRFHGGAFGFSPRIVILEGGRAIFDEVVPFVTRRGGGNVQVFTGSFVIRKRGLALDGAVSLESLDQNLRGHPTLELKVQEKGKLLGAGRLKPGAFAEVGKYRVGFAGLKKWLEIDISRRTYSAPMLAGAALFLLGIVAWPIGAWRRR